MQNNFVFELTFVPLFHSPVFSPHLRPRRVNKSHVLPPREPISLFAIFIYKITNTRSSWQYWILYYLRGCGLWSKDSNAKLRQPMLMIFLIFYRFGFQTTAPNLKSRHSTNQKLTKRSDQHQWRLIFSTQWHLWYAMLHTCLVHSPVCCTGLFRWSHNDLISQ